MSTLQIHSPSAALERRVIELLAGIRRRQAAAWQAEPGAQAAKAPSEHPHQSQRPA